MATRNTLSVETLESIGVRRLAEILIAWSDGDAAAKRELRLEVAAVEGPQAAAGEIRKRLAAISRARTFVRRSRASTLAYDLEMQREAIEEHVSGRDPAGALTLLWRFMSLADRVLQRCDDSDGVVADVFRSARGDLGRAAAEARPEPAKLAGQVFDALWSNSLGQYDGLVGELAPALGEHGLDVLRQKVLAFRAELVGSRSRDETAPGNVVAGPWSSTKVAAEEDDGRYLLEYSVPHALSDIADALGDVDGYVEQYDERQRRIPAFAARIARRLLDAERAEEAWRVIDDAEVEESDDLPPLHREWQKVRIDVLESLGRLDEAQAARWRNFEVELDAGYLREYLKRLSNDGRAKATERALDRAGDHQNVHWALRFLLDWPDVPRAAGLVIRREAELNGDFYEVLNAAASSFAAEHPLPATLALRAMVDFTLGSTRSTRYRHAVRQLRRCAELARRIDDYRGFPDHDSYMEEVRETNVRKTKFWRLMREM